MPKFFNFKVAGYFLYFTSMCIVECMHAHASDSKLTEPGSAKFFVKEDGETRSTAMKAFIAEINPLPTFSSSCSSQSVKKVPCSL